MSPETGDGRPTLITLDNDVADRIFPERTKKRWWRVVAHIFAIYFILGTAQGSLFWYLAEGSWDCKPCAQASLEHSIMWGPRIIQKLVN